MTLIVIAIATIVVFTGSGFGYLSMWRDAGRDLAALLPTDAVAFASSPPPWAAFNRAATLERWKDPEAVKAALLESGFVVSERTGELGGIPVELMRELQVMRSIDSVQWALVPADQGVTSLLFIEVADLVKRRRVISKLGSLLEPHSRHAGFRVDVIKKSPWQRFAGFDDAVPRVFVMEPYIVLAWGADDGVEELLEARVGGRGDSIDRHDGYAAFEQADRTTALRMIVDPGALFAAFGGDDDGKTGAPVNELKVLDAAVLSSRWVDDDEVFSVRGTLAAPAMARRLSAAMGPGPHELLELAPSDAPFAVSVIVADPRAALGLLRETLGGAWWRELGALALVEDDVVQQFVGEVALIGMPAAAPDLGEAESDPGWVLLARLDDPDRAAAALAELLPIAAPQELAIGRRRTLDGWLFLARDVLATPEAPQRERLAWRVKDGLLQLAPSHATLQALEVWESRARLHAHAELARHATRHLKDEVAAVAIIDPAAARSSAHPLVKMVTSRLDRTFRVALTLEVGPSWVEVESNLGLWTLATVFAAADREELDALMLSTLTPECRDAHLAMCRVYPMAVPCHPFSLGRNRRIRAACDALFAASPDGQ